MPCLKIACFLVIALSWICLPVPAQTDVLMNRYDLQLTGANLTETTLNTTNVNTRQFGKLWSYPVGGQVYAQPLYVSGVTIPGAGIRNVVYIVDMHNDIYAFDADDPGLSNSPYWMQSLGHSVPLPNPQIGYPGYPDIKIEVGIMSTPVIDKSTNTIYFVSKSQYGSTIADSLHALDLSTGQPKFGGSQGIAATINGSGDGGSTVSFLSHTQNQRCALRLFNGIVYIAYASYGDTPPYHGWIFGYDAGNLHKQSIAFNLNPNTQYAGIWMAGAGPSVDSAGNLYVISGNGLQGTRDLGESFLKLTPDVAHGTLEVADYFTPYSKAFLDSSDDDLGSAGALLIPNSHMIVSAGKEGLIYLVDENSMGQYHAGTDNSADQVLQEIEAFPGQLMGTPVFWADSAGNPNTALTYWWSQSDVLKAFRIDIAHRQLNPVPYARGPASEQPQLQNGILSLSANGNATGSGILWASFTLATDSLAKAGGTLAAYNANTLNEIWNSGKMAVRDSVGSFAKFVPPMVTNGKVYLATFSGTVNVYGLLAAVPAVYGSFTATREDSIGHLQWTTTNENDITVFNVLRSLDSIHFSPIGAVPGNGNSSVMQNYSFDDLKPLTGVNYYRLQEVDANGGTGYSPIVSVDIDLSGKIYMQVFPNPAHNEVTVIYNGLNTGDNIGLEMYNSGGSLVYRQEVIADGSGRVTIWRSPSMCPGVYYLVVTLPSGEKHQLPLIWGS
ncbi:MAG TPA: T9SS type A sorting domain-containing protein [Puia sp.]|nr:T9SS type A sorting domain-containing protein [Puia sp.]